MVLVSLMDHQNYVIFQLYENIFAVKTFKLVVIPMLLERSHLSVSFEIKLILKFRKGKIRQMNYFQGYAQ